MRPQHKKITLRTIGPALVTHGFHITRLCQKETFRHGLEKALEIENESKQAENQQAENQQATVLIHNPQATLNQPYVDIDVRYPPTHFIHT
jgi:hypothetical protein